MDAKMKVERAAAGAAIDGVLKYVNHGDDRTKALLNLTDFVQKFTGNMFAEKTFDNIRTMLQNPDNKWVQYINRGLDELDPQVIKMTALNLGFQAAFVGTKQIRMNREKYNCNIPWTMLMDPTSACNLHCTGCWAAEYGHKLNLSYEKLSDIISQGKELGTYFDIFTGGEPLVRKKDILRLAEEHHDCEFHCFTNGTLIDEEFCQDMLRVGNFIPAISLEGFEEANDSRRGEGVYDKVTHAMALLKQHHLPFGISACYTSVNYKDITSEKFYDLIMDLGAYFVWFFHYMPVGNEAAPELMPTPEQRKYMIDRIRYLRSEECDIPFYPMDFQNDGEFVGGCIAGGRNYFHINSAGDAEPCVFIHYSNANIHDQSILEILHSPLFMAYHNGQPFNKNHLRPCPMLENPELLQKMVHETGAHSTDLQSPESVEHLCEKCKSYAANWQPTADEIWSHTKIRESRYENYKDWKPSQPIEK